MATTSQPASFRSDGKLSAAPVTGAPRFRVGLTGGIGSGKSLVAEEFSRLGAYVIDADAIAHTLTGPQGDAIEPIRAEFGADFVDQHGALNRARMRDLVFGDSSARKALERLLHPMIGAEASKLGQAAPRSTPYLVFSIPLLIESGTWRDRVDRVLVIDCAMETQIVRVMRRSRLARRVAHSIIASQATRAARLDAADDILVNESTADEARQRVTVLHTFYSQLGRAARGGTEPRVSL
jgi:dephospho-CoA kinase